METSFFHRLSNLLWRLIVTLVVLFAIYVSVGRMLASNVGHYSEGILAELNARVPFTVEAKHVSGEWHSFTPRLILSGLRVTLPGMEHQPLELTSGSIGLDVLDSLRTRSLQATQLELHGLHLNGELDDQGRFRLSGLDGSGGEMAHWLQDFLLNVERIKLTRNVLELALPGDGVQLLDLELELVRSGSQRYLDATLQSTRGARIRALGEGVGDPFQPQRFRGDLYFDIAIDDLAAMPPLLTRGLPPLSVDGAVNLELWLDWDRGSAGLESRLRGRDLRLSPRKGGWEIPLERVAMEARMLEQKNRHTLFISDLELSAGGETIYLPRLQVDFWGNALRLRARDIDLAPASALVAGLDLTPSGLAEVFRNLYPRGTLDFLQLNVGDIDSPAEDWELEVNFSSVAVDSWKGAPGVTSAAGYVELADGAGFMLLDSQDISLEFPSVYRKPLLYDDLNGTIDIGWDASGLRLSSGLVSARAEEGDAKILFGLAVPFEPAEAGIEMDLLVGLADTRPSYRSKYLPFTLEPQLLQWLAESVGEGRVEQAAFIWRGSLRPHAGDLRTVQLAVEIADTRLDYHPGWPAIEGLDGVLLLDDTDVSVWAENARLHNTVVHQLSAEAWMDPSHKMQLAIDSNLRGPAADGLAVLNHSPLRQYVKDAFADWQLAGGLDTELQLLIALGDSSVPPRVDVTTHWHDVDVTIPPGDLSVLGVSGMLAYDSELGFHSENLAGSLWGQPLTVDVQQAEAVSRAPGEGLPPVQVDVATEVDMAAVREWLNLDLLRFAEGRSAIGLRIDVTPGETPVLTANSDLVGVSLDLPPPWNTPAENPRPLTFSMPLGGSDSRLEFALSGDVNLVLALQDGSLAAGALAFNSPVASLQAGRFRISGSTPLLDLEGWNRFLAEYFSVDLLSPQPAGGAKAVAGDPNHPVSVAESQFPAISIEQLFAERVLVAGQTFRAVTVGCRPEQDGWRVSAQNDWLQGDLVLEGAGRRLTLQRLDLAGLDQLDLAVAGDQKPLDIPDLDVAVNDLRSDGHSLGRLAFLLRGDGPELRAENITGELAGLRMEAQHPGQLRWTQGESSSTALAIQFAFTDFGDTLEALGYQRILETKQGTLGLDLTWPGAPQNFSSLVAEGSLLLESGAGSFLEAPAGASGALRVVGILDLASIVRRLSLSQMFESGIPFDTMEGEVHLHSGTIEVSHLDVMGTTSRFQFKGVSEVATRTMDGELVATLPVANNLPWVAALAGGLPVAAGVFVVSKVFEKQFDALSSAVYRIEGNWDDPEIRFDRIWDAGGASRPPPAAVAPDPQSPEASPAASYSLSDEQATTNGDQP